MAYINDTKKEIEDFNHKLNKLERRLEINEFR